MNPFCWTILLIVSISGTRTYEKLRSIHAWKRLEYAFPNELARQNAIKSGEFVPGAAVPIDVDVYNGGHQSRIFVTTPRIENGIPATLGCVIDDQTLDGNPMIAPYPNWGYNSLGNCDSITSVYRMKIDECGRLWVLDTGKVGDNYVCRPQILVFSLETNELISRYRFPRDQYKDDSLYVTVAVDVRDPHQQCKDTFAYIADVTGFALIVYDYRNSRSWKIVNNLFYPYPPYGTFDIRGETFDLMDGILGLALGPMHHGDRTLYFHSLASRVESWVPTSVIRNHTMFDGNAEASARSFVPFTLERSSQSAAQAMDRNGVLFYGLLSELSIGCWNSKSYPEYGGSHNEVVVTDPETLQFPAGMKIITSKNDRQEIWVLTASFQKYMTGSLNSNETNFRILAGFVEELVRGTKCDVVATSIRNMASSHYKLDMIFRIIFRDMWWSWWMALFFGAVSLERQVETLQVQNHKLQTQLQMKYVDFEFDSDKERKEAIDSGRYDRTKCIPIDVDRRKDGLMFVTVVRDKGVPASLTTVSDKKGRGGPLLKPYPNWSWYNHNNCNKPHIIGVYRVAIDECDRLWVLDTGMTGSEATCPPQLLSFDLTTDELLSAVTVPKEFAVNSTTGKGLLVTPIVRTLGSGCPETQVFIADPDGYALLVYDTCSTKWRRVISSALVYDPKAVTYTIAGESFDLMDGPVGMALSPTGQTLYLSPMSSYKMVSASTDQLIRAKGVDDSVPFEVHEKLDSQLSAKAMSSKGTLFFGITGNASIGCWNERKALTEDNMMIIAQDPKILQFVSGAKVVNHRYRRSQELLVLSNRYQKFVTGTMNFDEINFRILKGYVDLLIMGSVCDPRT
ncbi:uncharacterized protein LOC128885082 [Hylaeus volcanicus]|uniref:uncharacterized protein LOC128885082 n=1 Tax=Hylaeus volcanicus TaxID=313075 RepID=UPI0023B85CF3|nr:uncharacterized protein LOC128885082 [Hylaeus volcanicus]